MTKILLATLSVVLMSSLACQKSVKYPPEESAPAQSTPASSTPSKSALTDGQIAQIVLNANSGEIDQATVAEKNGANGEARDFAKKMIADHSNNKSEVQALVTKLNLSPAESDISKKLADDSKATVDKLNQLKGADLDKAYIDAQVKAHTDVLNLFDTALIPNAQNAELKAALTKTRPVIAGHLDHAKKIQSSVAGPKM